MPASWSQRYLDFLGVETPVAGLEGLERIAGAHSRVPFENLTSLLRRRDNPGGAVPPLDRDALLDSWRRGSSGGLCFDVTTMLLPLLQELGYEAHAVLAQITFPGSHQAILVKLEGARYLLDLGNGAPMFQPIAIDDVAEVHRAGLSYRFRLEGGRDNLVQDRLIEGAWRPFATYDLAPAGESEREAAYQRHHSLPAESFVMGPPAVVLCRQDEVLQLRELQFNRFTAAGKQSRPVQGPYEYRRVLDEAFGLSGLPIEEGLAAWQELTARAAV